MSYYSHQYETIPGTPGPRVISSDPYVDMPPRSNLVTRGNIKKEYVVYEDGHDFYDEDHLYPPEHDGAIAQVPPPKDTHYHVNEDPSLGGRTWRVPRPTGPCSDFSKACIKTPGSSSYNRVIPWDHKKKDFVYGAVHDHVFRGRYDRRRLKRKMDYVKAQGSWDPVSGYNCCFICCLLTGALILLAWLMFYIWKPYCLLCYYLRQWWFWFLVPFFLLMFLITYCCIVRASSNHATRNRYRYIKRACDDINDRNLRGSGVEVRPGTKGAWLEVDMDDGRTDIVGGVIPDRRIYSGEEREALEVQKQTILREEYNHKSQIPIEGRPKDDYTVRERRTGTVVEEVVADPLDYNTQVVEETVVRSGSTNSRIIPSSTKVVEETVVVNSGNPKIINTSANSNKKMSFYEKLQASKMGHEVRGGSPIRSPGTVVSGGNSSINQSYARSPRMSNNLADSQVIVGGSGNSAKNMDFYERLRKAKEEKLKNSSQSPRR